MIRILSLINEKLNGCDFDVSSFQKIIAGWHLSSGFRNSNNGNFKASFDSGFPLLSIQAEDIKTILNNFDVLLLSISMILQARTF